MLEVEVRPLVAELKLIGLALVDRAAIFVVANGDDAWPSKRSPVPGGGLALRRRDDPPPLPFLGPAWGGGRIALMVSGCSDFDDPSFGNFELIFGLDPAERDPVIISPLPSVCCADFVERCLSSCERTLPPMLPAPKFVSNGDETESKDFSEVIDTILYPLEDLVTPVADVVDVRDCEEVDGIIPVDFLFLLGRGGIIPPTARAGNSVGLSFASSNAENGSLCSWLLALRVDGFLGLGMGLGPDTFPIPGSRSRELDDEEEVGGAAVETAGVGVKMEELLLILDDEDDVGCSDRGVSVATRVCVCVCVFVQHTSYMQIIVKTSGTEIIASYLLKHIFQHVHALQRDLPMGSMLKRLGIRGGGSPPAP